MAVAVVSISYGQFRLLNNFNVDYYLFRLKLDGDDIPGIGQYEDFHTIDWQRDIARDRMRHRYIVKKVQNSLWDFLKVSTLVHLYIEIILITKIKPNLRFRFFRVRMMRGQVGCVCY